MISASEVQASRTRSMCRTERAWWIVSLGLGLLALWVRKYAIYSDGISYLEIAAKYRAGDWKGAVNAYWSPLYSWVLAAAGWLLRPSAQWEVPMLHLVNFLAFAGSLFTFRFLLRQLTLFVTDNRGLQTEQDYRSWISVAYALFLWGGLYLTDLGLVMPDGIVALLLYAITGVLIIIARGRSARRHFVLLGSLIGLCYLTKAAFFVGSVLFLVPILAVVKPFSVAVKRALIAGGTFAIVVSPWIVTISQTKGHWTIGTSGTINYSWEVGPARRWTHWQGEPGDMGFPAHPTVRLMDSPPVFGFGKPIEATYPPWYDPSYWYEGIKPSFLPFRQAYVFLLNLRYVGALILAAPGLAWCIWIFGTNRDLRFRFRALMAKAWIIWFPPLGLIIMYGLVVIEDRYVAAALVTIALTAMAAAFGTCGHQVSKRNAVRLSVATCAAFLAFQVLIGVYIIGRDLVNGKEMFPNRSFQVAQEMEATGLRRGASIAYIGEGRSADWARILGARIVAEISVRFDRSTGFSLSTKPNRVDTDSFWKATPEKQQEVLDTFQRAGAEAVAADLVPEWANTSGWIRLSTPIYKEEGTPWTYLHFLAPPSR